MFIYMYLFNILVGFVIQHSIGLKNISWKPAAGMTSFKVEQNPAANIMEK
jgi:hypothetical protein